MSTIADVGAIDVELELDRLEDLSRSGHRHEVVERCTRLLEHSPEEGRLYFCRAHARNVLRDRVGALEDMARAAEKMPNEPAAAFFCGLWRLESGAYAAGMSAVERAIELEEALGSAYYVTSARFLRALGHALLGQVELARQALAALPEDTEVLVRGKLWTLQELRALVETR